MAASAAASSGPVWSQQNAVLPTAPDGLLSAVSCGAAASCEAAGQDVGRAGATTLRAEAWNGSAWAAQKMPMPPGAAAAPPTRRSRELDSGILLGGGPLVSDMSCASPTACAVVGAYGDTWGVRHALAEAWNGTAWSIEAVPLPAGATDPSVAAVSCAAPTACLAVGGYHNGTTGDLLAETWDGTVWSSLNTPNPTGSTNAFLTGVSCTSATACRATGSYYDSASVEHPFADRWNGTTWTFAAVPPPTGATFASLDSVSCTSTTACVAVGAYQDSSFSEHALAEVWNGSSWSVVAVPSRTGSSSVGLDRVACASAAACTAVGSFYDSASARLVAEAVGWNGTAWSLQTVPSPGGVTNTMLSAVACNSVTACVAVGSSGGSSGVDMLAETWSGSKWAIKSPRTPAGAAWSTFAAVGCSSSTSCVTVGEDHPGTTTNGVAETWNGTAWKIAKMPRLAGSNVTLTAIACVPAGTCTAVGATGLSPQTSGLAESWNGVTWTDETVPSPNGATSDGLNGVSCTSTTACTAVGFYLDSSGAKHALAEGWNGSAWSVEVVPSLAGVSAATFTGVSCPSSTACTAVGSFDDSFSSQWRALAESWNGTSWAEQVVPSPTGTTSAAFTSVSCTSSSACVAVGSDQNASSVQQALAERWNGAAWAGETLPIPSGATYTALSGVSCPSATACTAVGAYAASGNEESLVEAWNGSGWSLQPVPLPTGATNPSLNSVACTSAIQCTAAGSFSPPPSGQLDGLLERYS